jgi:hypothetical protein
LPHDCFRQFSVIRVLFVFNFYLLYQNPNC